jgi:hypothetical protein
MDTIQQTNTWEIEHLEQETVKAIRLNQREKVIELFRKTEQLFLAGSEYTKTVISNKFIFPVSMILEINYSWGKSYLDLFPEGLKKEYCRQVGASGI